QVEATETHRPLQEPADAVRDGMEARRLLDDGIEVGELTHPPRIEGAFPHPLPHPGPDVLLHLGPLEDTPEDPAERRRRGLVAGHQEGEELVPQLLVAHRAAVVVARVDQHGQDVVAPTRSRGAPVGYGSGDRPVDLAPAVNEAPPWGQPAEIDLRRADRDHGRARTVEEREEAEDRRPQAVPLRGVVDTEDALKDTLA